MEMQVFDYLLVWAKVDGRVQWLGLGKAQQDGKELFHYWV